MRNLSFFGLLLLVLTLGLTLAGCGGDSNISTPAETEAPLVLIDTVDNKEIEITISRPGTSMAVITPRAGDNYRIRFDNELISFGNVTANNNGRLRFRPSPDSPCQRIEFDGTLDDSGSLSIPSITCKCGTFSGIRAGKDRGKGTGNLTPGTGKGNGGGGWRGGAENAEKRIINSVQIQRR